MVRSSSLPRSLSIFLSAITLALLSSCTSKKVSSSVQIKIPNFSSSNAKTFSQSVAALSGDDGNGGGWGLSHPTSLSEFKCFGVFVGAAEPGLNGGKAYDTSNNFLFSFGLSKGLVGQGGTISLEVPSGPRRTITLIGFGLANGATCEPMTNESNDINGSFYSAPFILGQVTVDLQPGNSPPIAMTASYTAGTSTELGEVDFPSGSGGGGNSGPPVFTGHGLDGDITITGNGDLSTIGNSPIAPMTPRWLTTSRPLLSAALVTGFTNRVRLSLDGSVGSLNYGPRDEVMMYVPIERGLSSASGCGVGSMRAGDRIHGEVKAVNFAATPKTIDVEFKDPTRILSLSNLAVDPDVSSAADYCKVTVNRVPNVNRFVFNADGEIQAPGMTSVLSNAPAEGGLLVLRVKDYLKVDPGVTASFTMTGKGYRGGITGGMAGQSYAGYRTPLEFNSFATAGGASQSFSSGPPIIEQRFAGGGGNASAGLEGWSTSLSNWFPNAGWMSSTGVQLWNQILMGGGGGDRNAPTDNNGGGIIMIVANKIDIDTGGSLSIKSNGNWGDITGGGGGGGSVLLRALHFVSTGTFFASADGGNAGGPSVGASDAYVGAGGGGRIHIDLIISCSNPTSTVQALGGETGVFAGPNKRSAFPGTIHKTGAAASIAGCNLP